MHVLLPHPVAAVSPNKKCLIPCGGSDLCALGPSLWLQAVAHDEDGGRLGEVRGLLCDACKGKGRAGPVWVQLRIGV